MDPIYEVHTRVIDFRSAGFGVGVCCRKFRVFRGLGIGAMVEGFGFSAGRRALAQRNFIGNVSHTQSGARFRLKAL